MIRDWVSEWVERRTPQVENVHISAAENGTSDVVRVRYTLSDAPSRVVVFGEPVSRTRTSIDGGNFASTRRGEGFWQIQFGNHTDTCFVDFACEWPVSTDEFRVWADVPTVGLRRVQSKLIPAVQIANLGQGLNVSYVESPSDSRRLVAATLTRNRAASSEAESVREEAIAGTGATEPSYWTRVTAVREEIAGALDTRVGAQVLLSSRTSVLAADYASVGVVHRPPVDARPGDHEFLGDLVLRWELASLWWGGVVQAVDSGAEQLLLSLRVVTAICTSASDLGATASFLAYLRDSSTDDWRRWMDPVVRDARALLALPRPDLVSRLQRAHRVCSGRRVSARFLRPQLLAN